MNPDVFITIVFVGIAVLVALVGLVLVVPSARREGAGAPRRDPRRTGAPATGHSDPGEKTATAKRGRGAIR